jgi:hypothetical protein
MGYRPEQTPILLTCLRDDRREFTASELEGRTAVPRKFVRRALTKDPEQVARSPMPGVTMVLRDRLWRYSWTGIAEAETPPPPPAS